MMKFSRLIPDIEVRHIFLLAVLTLVETLQLLVIVALIFSFIPHAVNKFVENLFPLYQKTLKPEREMDFYHFFVFAGIAMQAAFLYLFRQKLSNSHFGDKLIGFIVVDSFWLSLQFFAIFKIVLYGDPLWARILLYCALGLSVVTKIFWPELQAWIRWIKENYQRIANKKNIQYGSVAMVGMFIASVIYVWDVDRILGFIAAWGNWARFHEWRQENIAVLRQLDDEQFLRAAMIGAVVYFWLMFAILRSWLNSILLATGAVFLAIKWQFFHLGAAPVIWQYPQKMNVTFFIDLGLFALLLAYVRLGRKLLFWIAAAGLCVEGGRYICTAVTAPDTIPLYTCLRERNFFAFDWQFVIPVIYALTFLAQLIRDDRRREDVMVMAASLFGMAVFAGHVKDSTMTNYYTHSLPLVMVFGYWTKYLCGRLTAGRAMAFKITWALVLTAGLMTNVLFMQYPNIYDVSGIKWEQVTMFYQQQIKGVKP